IIYSIKKSENFIPHSFYKLLPIEAFNYLSLFPEESFETKTDCLEIFSFLKRFNFLESQCR
uniref:hypothetical protein n=1 Tax=Coxiella burnetii TaxID=777 RepID=UPI002271F3CF